MPLILKALVRSIRLQVPRLSIPLSVIMWRVSCGNVLEALLAVTVKLLLLEAGGWIFPLSPRRLHVLHDDFGAIAGFCGISTSHNKEPIKFTPFTPPLDRLDISYPRVSEYLDACAAGMHIKNSKSYSSSFFNPGTIKWIILKR